MNATGNGTVVAACIIDEITKWPSLIEQCNYVQTNCQNLLLDVLFCHMNYELWTRLFFIVVLFILLFFCFYLASSTAEDYFVPSLIKISQYLRLNENVAGLTLIAFGNSAPDLLTIILSTLKGNEQLGFAEPISAAAFVTTIVFALCILVSSSKQNRISKFFLRDVGFFFLVISFLFIIYLDGKVEYVEAVLCLIFYVLYVFLVYITGVIQKILKRRQLQQVEAKLQMNTNEIQDVDGMLQEMKNITTPTTPTVVAEANITTPSKSPLSKPMEEIASTKDTTLEASPSKNASQPDNEIDEAEKAIQYLADLHLYQKRLHKKYKKRREIQRKLEKMLDTDTAEGNSQEEYNNLNNYHFGSHSMAQITEENTNSLVKKSPMGSLVSPLARQATLKSFILPKRPSLASPTISVPVATETIKEDNSTVTTRVSQENTISDEVYKARLEQYTTAHQGRRPSFFGRFVENVIEKIIDKTGVDNSKVVNALQKEENIVENEIKNFNETVKQEVQMDAVKKEIKKQLNQEIDMAIQQELQENDPEHMDSSTIVTSSEENTDTPKKKERRRSIVEPFDGEFVKATEMEQAEETDSKKPTEKLFIFPHRRRHNMLITPEEMEHTEVIMPPALTIQVNQPEPTDTSHQVETEQVKPIESAVGIPESDNLLHEPTPTTLTVEKSKWEKLMNIRDTIGDSVQWDSKSFKDKCFFVFVEAFWVFVRNITIFKAEKEEWNKFFACLVPIFAPQLFLLAIGDVEKFKVDYFVYPLPMLLPSILFLLGCSFSLFILMTSLSSEPPFYFPILVFCSAFMSMVWIAMIIEILILILECVAVILNIPTAALAITLLSYGNSAGDIFSNISIARKGFLNMSVSSSFGAPIINSLVGIGLSYVIRPLVKKMKGLPVEWCTPIEPASGLITLTFIYLLTTLVMSMVSVSLMRFKVGKWYAIVLIVSYGIFISLITIGVFVPSFAKIFEWKFGKSCA